MALTLTPRWLWQYQHCQQLWQLPIPCCCAEQNTPCLWDLPLMWDRLDPEGRTPLWYRSCLCLLGTISTLDSERKPATISNFCSKTHFSHLFFHSWLGPHSVYFSLLVLWLLSFIRYNLGGSIKCFVLTQWHYLIVHSFYISWVSLLHTMNIKHCFLPFL